MSITKFPAFLAPSIASLVSLTIVLCFNFAKSATLSKSFPSTSNNSPEFLTLEYPADLRALFNFFTSSALSNALELFKKVLSFFPSPKPFPTLAKLSADFTTSSVAPKVLAIFAKSSALSRLLTPFITLEAWPATLPAFAAPNPKPANKVNPRFPKRFIVSPLSQPSLIPFAASAPVETSPPITPSPGIKDAVDPANDTISKASAFFIALEVSFTPLITRGCVASLFVVGRVFIAYCLLVFTIFSRVSPFCAFSIPPFLYKENNFLPSGFSIAAILLSLAEFWSAILFCSGLPYTP